MSEPSPKRAVAFVDGQALFRAAKDAFGYCYPNYDVTLLASTICKNKAWALSQVRFYTGVPDVADDAYWNRFWSNKLTYLGQTGVVVYSRSLRYRNKIIRLPDGKPYTILVGQEKGIDVRIALDVIRLAHECVYDVALVFSQDQDLSEVADELRTISKEQSRWIHIASAYPASPTYDNRRGINKTDWIPIDRKTYDSCIDPREYRK